jgi:hypothetical protein
MAVGPYLSHNAGDFSTLPKKFSPAELNAIITAKNASLVGFVFKLAKLTGAAKRSQESRGSCVRDVVDPYIRPASRPHQFRLAVRGRACTLLSSIRSTGGLRIT